MACYENGWPEILPVTKKRNKNTKLLFTDKKIQICVFLQNTKIMPQLQIFKKYIIDIV